MDITLTTPALLFPALSLLLLAYTNRYLSLAALVRRLFDDHQTSRNPKLLEQIGSLKTRLFLIKWMQTIGVLSMFLCTVTMLQIYINAVEWAHITFGVSLAMMITSLALSLIELHQSNAALHIMLSDLEKDTEKTKKF